MAGSSRRNDRGPITHRAASLVIAPMPDWRAVVAPPGEQLVAATAWLRHDVQASVSERTRSG